MQDQQTGPAGPAPTDSALLLEAMTASQHMIFLVLDRTGRIVRCNRGAQEASGYAEAELLGRHPAFLFDRNETTAYMVELASRYGRSFFEVLPDHLRDHPGEAREWTLRCKDGSRRLLHLEITPVGPAAAPVAMLLSATDISARRSAENEREKARELFSRFMDNFPGFAYLKDGGYRFIYVNQDEHPTFGRHLQQAWLGHTVCELFPAAVSAVMHDNDRRVLEQDETVEGVEEVDAQDGSRQYFYSCKFPVRLPDGSRLLGGVSMDITPLKRLEHELDCARLAAEQAAEAKGFFVANISHEIRTPLNGIIGMLELLRHSPLNAEQNEHLRILRQSADALLAIVNDVLDFSRMETQQPVLEQQPFDLRELVDGVMDLLSLRAEEKGLAFNALLPPALPQFTGDAARLRQILINLAGNAIKFTASGGVRIDATVRPVDGNACALDIHVRDTGIGIAAEAWPRLFHAFSQLDNTHGRRAGGSGLGLVISQRLAAAMGGDIRLDSTPGAGSVFTLALTLPVARAAAPLAWPSPPRVLVVSPQAHDRAHLQDFCAGLGWAAQAVASVSEAEAQLQADVVVPLLVIDLRRAQLPELAHWRRLGASCPRLLLTAQGQRPAGLAPGAREAVLAQPLKQGHFLEAAASLLAAGALPQAANEAAAPAARRVLVVDDDDINRLVAARGLEKLGYRVLLAGDGLEALALMQREAIDAVLLDCQMPGLDGLEVARRWRMHEQQHGGRLPILAVAANILPETRAACLAAGMDDFLPKPLRLELLAARMEKHLAQQAGRQEARA
jgi:PAS domain S-box-containing protein